MMNNTNHQLEDRSEDRVRRQLVLALADAVHTGRPKDAVERLRDLRFYEGELRRVRLAEASLN